MITEWTISSFKSIGDKTTISLAPLTIFCGVNSSGKSTVIQSMLLISQTLASKVSSRSVVLNGSLAKLGQFDDLKTVNSQAEDISIGWKCRPIESFDPLGALSRTSPIGPRSSHLLISSVEQIDKLSCSLAFTAGGTGAEHDLQQLQPQLLRFSMHHHESDTEKLKSSVSITRLPKDNQFKAKLDGFEIAEPENETLRSGLFYNVDLDPDSLEEITDEYPSATPLGCTFRHFLPTRLTVRLEETKETTNYIFSELSESRTARTRGRLPVDVSLSRELIDLLRRHIGERLSVAMFGSVHARSAQNYTLQDWRARRRKLLVQQRIELRNRLLTAEAEADIFTVIKREGKPRYSIEAQRIPREILSCVNYLDSYFTSSLKYLGPLRDEPKALYPIATSTDPSDVGIRGENTAAVYDLHRKRKIPYLPSTGFAKAKISDTIHRTFLSDAVLDWLKYLGVASEVNTKDRGKLGHELRVMTADTPTAHDLTHVGVGVSQVLPILVACLLAEEDSVLIIEQPELHLHPRVQTLLADFFMSMALLGKQCILETHSEYLINRLRYRIASADDDSLLESTKIYFAEKSEGTSKYRPVPINEFGAIIDWPTDFFDESQKEAEALLRAAMEKRRARSAKK